MPILTATNIRHAYGERVILDGVTISIEPDERVGIVGRNGMGKSTLLRVMEGVLRPDAGEVSLRKGARVGYLRQDPTYPAGMTMRDAAGEAFATLADLHRQLDAIFHEMESAGGDALDKLLNRQADLERQMEAAGGYAIDHRIDAVLHGLGFTDAQFTLPIEKLSGGQRSRVALAKLLLENPDVLLLDEPTNHLDIDGRIWLEAFLADEFKGAVVLISHDRYLLDRVVDRIVEVERTRLIEYPGNYSTFRKLRAERREAQGRAWEAEQRQFKKEEAFIRKYKAGQRAKQAKGRESRLDRAKAGSDLERPMELAAFVFRLPKSERPGDLVFVARELTKRYTRDDDSTLTLFQGLSLTIERGERWGIVGPNGAGKTTLVRTLLKQIEPDAGTVTIGSRVAVGEFRQIADDLDPDINVVRYLQKIIQRENPGKPLSEQEARDLAGQFLFSGNDQSKPMGVMSGGERARARLAALLASAKNVLVLDEPTNHLDIPSAERLEDALVNAFDGTLILISHDRALIDATCDNLLIFDGAGNAKVFHGSYSEWAEAERSRASRPSEPIRDRDRRTEAAPRADRLSEPVREVRVSEPAQSSRRASDQPPIQTPRDGGFQPPNQIPRHGGFQPPNQIPRGGGFQPPNQIPRGGGFQPPIAQGDANGRPLTSAPSNPVPIKPRKSRFSWMSSDKLEARIAELEGEIARLDERMNDPAFWTDAIKAAATSAKREELRSELSEIEEEWLGRMG